MTTRRALGFVISVASMTVGSSCAGCDPRLPSGWTALRTGDAAALLSVQERDGTVWVAGADADGDDGPATATLLVDDDLLDDDDFPALPLDVQGDLWWVHPTSATTAIVGGSGGRVARVDREAAAGERLVELDAPATLAPEDVAERIVFGVWQSDDGAALWAVGARFGGLSGGFVWRSDDGGPLVDVTPDASVTEPVTGGLEYGLWKVSGTAADDVWLAGTNGLTLHWDGAALTAVGASLSISLFTVYADDQGALAVGGLGRGFVLRHDVGADGAWQDVTPTDDGPTLFGVHRRGRAAWVVGDAATVLHSDDAGASFAGVATGLPLFQTLHAVHATAPLAGADDGVVLAVGGTLTGLPLTNGALIRFVP